MEMKIEIEIDIYGNRLYGNRLGYKETYLWEGKNVQLSYIALRFFLLKVLKLL